MRLPSIAPGQLFVVEVSGWCGGSGGVLRYETEAGSADVPSTSTCFSFPVAVTDTDDDAIVVVKIKTLPTGALSIKTIKVWKVD